MNPGPNFAHLSRLARLSLRTRLLLLVVASAVPLTGLGLVREYGQYRTERDTVYQGLLTTARGVAVAVDRDLMLRTAALEALAMSPQLQAGDFDAFDAQARLFLARQPESAALGLMGPDHRVIKAYGIALPPGGASHTATAGAEDAFQRAAPIVTDLHRGHVSGEYGFSIDVPVFHDDQVSYVLFLRLRPSAMQHLLTQQHLPPDRAIAITDSTGAVVAREPEPERFIGRQMIPALWEQVRSHTEGLRQSQTLEGAPAVVAYTHVAPFNWSVSVGAPESVVLAPLRDGLVRISVEGLFVLSVGLLLATMAARGITAPIAELARLAESDSAGGQSPVATGLAETDTVARALEAAAAERRAAADALAESEQRFRALFEHSPSGLLLVDPGTLEVLDCNEAAASFLGYHRSNLRGVCMLDLRFSSSEDQVRQVARTVAGGGVVQYETRLRGQNGLRDLFVAVGPIRLGGRTVILVNQIDITELRKAERDLRLQDERLELARNGASLGIWDWDLVSDTVTWSEHAFALHGVSPDPDGPGPTAWPRVIDPDDDGSVREEFRRTLRVPGHRFNCEYTVNLPDGSKRRLLARGQGIRDPDGKVVRLVGVVMDVSIRFEAEKARDALIELLQAERSRLSMIVEALPVGVGIAAADGQFVLRNPALARFVGPALPSNRADAAPGWIGYHSAGQPVDAEDYPGNRALAGETVLPGVDFLVRNADGTERWLRVGATPLGWRDGVVAEALIVIQDIDAERRLVDLERQANARLEHRVREEVSAREAAQQRAAQAERVQALGQIAGGIAHGFNNVLQAVTGGAALIERRPDQPDRVLRHVRMIADAARRGASITSRLLTFARRVDLRAESLDAAALLHDMAEVLSHTLGGSVRCEVDAPADTPPLFADRGQLETVLVNLATNARDAMPNGGTLTFSARPEVVAPDQRHPAGLAAGAYTRISAADIGKGMSEGVLARVTEPFFTTKEPGKGTGLGLAMAKGFVEQSGGRLAIESVEGQGTTIHLWLPQADCGKAEPEPAGASLSRAAAAPAVLLVDDDPIVRTVLSAALEDSGFTVLAADSGRAALDLVRRHHSDVMVTDLTMPEMDGLTLIREVRMRLPALPTVLLTGYAGDGATLAIGGAITGTFSLLRKPVTGLQLADRIYGLLEVIQSRQSH